MNDATLFFLLVPAFFVVLAAWVWTVWPRTDPTADATYQARERRSEHFRGEGR